MDRNIFLQGTRVILRPLESTDATIVYAQWLNDIEISKFNSHATFPTTISEIENYISSVSGSRSAVVLGIIDIEMGVHIGNISLQGIDWISRSAEFAILLGDRNFAGKGYAKEAAELVIQYGFERLNLFRIHCGTSAHNGGMQKLALSLGMKEEGRRRQAMYRVGRYVDILEYGMLRDEFFNRNTTS